MFGDVITGPNVTAEAPRQEPKGQWSPYVDNGGTVMAVAGSDYAVIVADTRTSIGYRIHTRNHSKVTQLTDQCCIASAGMQSECVSLHKMLKARIVMYEHHNRKQPSVVAIAQMLSTILYHKRFFPIYAFNLLAGVDHEGKGAVFSYDAIGSYERSPYSTSGSGSSLTLSVLDNQLLRQNQTKPNPELKKGEVVDLCKDILSSVGERDIHTGDYAEIFVIDTKITKEKFDLKKD